MLVLVDGVAQGLGVVFVHPTRPAETGELFEGRAEHAQQLAIGVDASALGVVDVDPQRRRREDGLEILDR